MNDFTGKVALVTGGSRGIGRAIARAFLERGASVAITATTQERADEAARSFESDRARGYAGAAADVVKAVLKDHDRVDILVCNAGITRDQLVLGMPDEEWQAVLDVNLTGAFRMIQALYRTFMRQRSGRIVTMSSAQPELMVAVTVRKSGQSLSKTQLNDGVSGQTPGEIAPQVWPLTGVASGVSRIS